MDRSGKTKSEDSSYTPLKEQKRVPIPANFKQKDQPDKTYPVYLENLSAPTTSIASLSAIQGKKSIPAINSGLIMKRISS